MTLSLRLSSIPIDIINVIFGKMSYKPQSKELMEDVRSFYQTKHILTEMYKNQFNAGHSPEEWLENDLWGWSNQSEPLMEGFHQKIYDLWKGMSKFWVNDMKAANYGVFGQMHPPPTRRHLVYYKIDCYLTNYLECKTSKVQIRLFLGAMKPQQRNEFIEIICDRWKEFNL